MKTTSYKIIAPAMLVLVLTIAWYPKSPTAARIHEPSAPPQQGDPSSALSRGRTLLKQGHADQALAYLQNALDLYTQAKNERGIAAARDALGDLYLVQGQYKVALDHYEKAYTAFSSAAVDDQKNAAATTTVASQAGATARRRNKNLGDARVRHLLTLRRRLVVPEFVFSPPQLPILPTGR